MSYERQMINNHQMPAREDLEIALLKALFRYNGVIKEFGADENMVSELADEFQLNHEQRQVRLITFYRRENREKSVNLWHRLLFRAADKLAQQKLVSKPSKTYQLTQKKEWMLTELGYDSVLKILNKEQTSKNELPIISYEVQKEVNKIAEQNCPSNYDPIATKQGKIKQISETRLRNRSFRFAVVEAYQHQCSLCGLKLPSPDGLRWEVEAAHIVPHSEKGKDDIWNGLALCRFHHWAFDVGWFGILDDYRIILSEKISLLGQDCGLLHNIHLFDELSSSGKRLILPSNLRWYPHPLSLKWHREHIVCR